MRRGFDGLAAIVQAALDVNPFDGHVFVFRGKRGDLIKVMSFLDVRELGGRLMPTRWQVQPVQKPQNRTVFVIKQMQFDTPLPAEVFTLRNLQQTR